MEKLKAILLKRLEKNETIFIKNYEGKIEIESIELKEFKDRYSSTVAYDVVIIVDGEKQKPVTIHHPNNFNQEVDRVLCTYWKKKNVKTFVETLNKYNCYINFNYLNDSHGICNINMNKSNSERTGQTNINFGFLPSDSLELRMEKILEEAKKPLNAAGQQFHNGRRNNQDLPF